MACRLGPRRCGPAGKGWEHPEEEVARCVLRAGFSQANCAPAGKGIGTADLALCTRITTQQLFDEVSGPCATGLVPRAELIDAPARRQFLSYNRQRLRGCAPQVRSADGPFCRPQRGKRSWRQHWVYTGTLLPAMAR